MTANQITSCKFAHKPLIQALNDLGVIFFHSLCLPTVILYNIKEIFNRIYYEFEFEVSVVLLVDPRKLLKGKILRYLKEQVVE